jgi:DNA-binding MarR family transcriptional regulator
LPPGDQELSSKRQGEHVMTLMSPLDLLTVSSQEQDVIRCLVRQPRLTLSEIAGYTRIPLDELEGLLKRMVRESRLNEDGESKFQVLIHNHPSRRERGAGLLESLFN